MRRVLTVAITALFAGPILAQTDGVAGPRLTQPAPIKPRRVVDNSKPEAPVNGVVILYGNQRCPTNAAGEEVVVCARRSAAEQFRIPKELRGGTLKPEYESFANRGQTILDGTKTGMGACDTTGPGGGAGCSLVEYSAWKRQRDAQKDAAKKIK